MGSHGTGWTSAAREETSTETVEVGWAEPGSEARLPVLIGNQNHGAHIGQPELLQK